MTLQQKPENQERTAERAPWQQRLASTKPVCRISRLLGQFHHILNSSLDHYDLDRRPDIRCHQEMFLPRSSRVFQKSHETHFDIHRFHRTLHILSYKSLLSGRAGGPLKPLLLEWGSCGLVAHVSWVFLTSLQSAGALLFRGVCERVGHTTADLDCHLLLPANSSENCATAIVHVETSAEAWKWERTCAAATTKARIWR